MQDIQDFFLKKTPYHSFSQIQGLWNPALNLPTKKIISPVHLAYSLFHPLGCLQSLKSLFNLIVIWIAI